MTTIESGIKWLHKETEVLHGNLSGEDFVLQPPFITCGSVETKLFFRIVVLIVISTCT